jgi:hypothetical protein
MYERALIYVRYDPLPSHYRSITDDLLRDSSRKHAMRNPSLTRRSVGHTNEVPKLSVGTAIRRGQRKPSVRRLTTTTEY